MTKEQILQNCIVEGNIVKLPASKLDEKLYKEVAKALNLIGGKWKGGKISGFVFETDPTDLLNLIANGENRNLKKEFQFFATPNNIADYLVELADLKFQDLILEPSAGQGAIIEAILRKQEDANICAIELMDVNSAILTKKGFYHELGDFLTIPNQPVYDKIIANPPFSKNQDIDHIKRMYECLKPSGRLVSIASESWINGSQKKQIEFRKWLEEIDAEILDVEKGSFKESGTMVGAKIIIINKSI